jgi:hydroxypyruvate isomerase
MPPFAANLSMLYREHGFLDRFAAAARDGLRAVEYSFPYAHPRTEPAARLARAPDARSTCTGRCRSIP